jgi:hypothetical protein
MNNLNQKVDGLSAALGNLTIGDDLRQNIDQQLANMTLQERLDPTHPELGRLIHLLEKRKHYEASL